MCLQAVATSIVNGRLIHETFKKDFCPFKAGKCFSGLINIHIDEDNNKVFFTDYWNKSGKLLDTSKKRIGYKYFETSSKGKLSSIYNSNIKRNVWYTSTGNLERSLVGQIYMTGFHILWNREDARKFYGDGTLFKVEYYDQFIYGFDRWNTQVVLAKKMRILGEA